VKTIKNKYVKTIVFFSLSLLVFSIISNTALVSKILAVNNSSQSQSIVNTQVKSDNKDNWFTKIKKIFLGKSASQGSSKSTNEISNNKPDKNYTEGKILVKYKKTKINLKTTAGASAATNLINSKSLEKEKDLNSENTSVLKIKDGKTVEEKIAELNNDPNIEYAQPNYQYSQSSLPINDSYKNSLWGLDNTGQSINGVTGVSDADIDMPEAWSISEGVGSSIIIAIIDNGVGYSHPDLVNNMWDGTNCLGDALAYPIDGGCPNHGYNFMNASNYGQYASNFSNIDPLDPNQDSVLPNPNPNPGNHWAPHGTHIAGTTSAVKNNSLGIAGVAPHTKIMALKTYYYTDEIIRSINFANNNGAKIINASFGGYNWGDCSMYDAIKNFDGLFIISAMNDSYNIDSGDPNKVAYPAGFGIKSYCGPGLDNIIVVAATTNSDGLATFSNYGVKTVNVGAPGKDIISTGIDENGQSVYYFAEGTSMAAPHVAGLAALLWGYNPNLTLHDVKAAILYNGNSISSLSGKTTTGKRINAQLTLQNARNYNTDKIINNFSINSIGVSGIISGTNIGITVPSGTDITNITPSISTNSINTTPIDPPSDQAQNFTNPVTYTVVAEDTSTKTYTVAMSSAANPTPSPTPTLAPTPTPTIPVPSAPTNLTGFPGDGEVSLTWNAPSDVGSSILDYQIDYGIGDSWITLAHETPITQTSTTITSLTNGISYNFRVSAINQTGIGSTSSSISVTPLNPVTPTEVPTPTLEPTPTVSLPSPPTNLNGTPGDSQVTLNWTEPVDVGSSIIDYQIEYGIGDSWFIFNHDPSNNTSSNIINLNNSISYSFRISAINQIGIGSTSSIINLTPTATVTPTEVPTPTPETTPTPTPIIIPVPSAPTDLTGFPGDGQVSLTWNAPSDVGSSIIDYQIEYKLSIGDSWTTIAHDILLTETSTIVSGLTNASSYDFRVSAINQTGIGSTSSSISVTPLSPITPTEVPTPTLEPTPTVSVPSSPTNLTGIEGDSQVSLSWEAPSDVGSSILDYQIDYGIGDSWITFAHEPSINTSIVVNGLTNDITYDFRVSAINQIGIGSTSSTISVTPLIQQVPTEVPTPTPTTPVVSAPNNLITVPGDEKVNLSWEAPSDIGSSILDYQIDYGIGDSWITFAHDPSINTSIEISGLTNGISYSFRVAAIDQNGLGSYANSQITVPTANIEELTSLITNAQSLYDSAVEGTNYGQYPPNAIPDFQTAINTATAVKNNLSSNQARIDLAVIALNNAISSFRDKRIVPTNIGATNISDLITYGTFIIPVGSSLTETPKVSLATNVTINIGDSSNSNTVYLPQGTEIIEHNNQSFNANDISALVVDRNTMSDIGSGFTKEAAIQWGIPNKTLTFSNPITINIYVGSGLNGTTLNVLRSPTGASDWTSEGIVSPATCLVSNGYCQFSATQASYFIAAAYNPVQNTSVQNPDNNTPKSSPVCSDTPPSNNPDLFELRTVKGSVKLFYSPSSSATAYAVLYGLKKGDERFGTIISTVNNNNGIQTADIYQLNPKLTYYFKVAAINGCTISPWSDWAPAKASKKSTIYKYKTIVKNKIKQLVSIFK